jgi:hypothetical protein
MVNAYITVDGKPCGGKVTETMVKKSQRIPLACDVSGTVIKIQKDQQSPKGRWRGGATWGLNVAEIEAYSC